MSKLQMMTAFRLGKMCKMRGEEARYALRLLKRGRGGYSFSALKLQAEMAQRGIKLREVKL